MKPNKQFVQDGGSDESLLKQGRYREFFYSGLSEAAQGFLRRPTDTLYSCHVCRDRKPAIDFTKGASGDWGQTCNECTINVRNGRGAQAHRWQNKFPTNWERNAACIDADPMVFFPKDKLAYAKDDAPWREFCPACPVQELCLAKAKKLNSVGVYGGEFFPYKNH